jgi:peptidoglycan hydrolase-like protein with peptidoglycan-binding domain
MRERPRPSAWLALGLAVALSSCGSDGAPATTTTVPGDTGTTSSSTPAASTTTSTSTTTFTSTTLPGGPALVVEGDRNETVEAFQFLLNCNGFGDLTLDGVFGPATLAAVEAAQESLGREVNGAPDEETLAELSRTCSEDRRLEGDEAVTVVGNAAPSDPEQFSVALLSDSTLVIAVTPPTGLTVTVTGADGAEPAPQGQSTWVVGTTQDYLIEVGAPSDPITFAATIEVTTGVREVGDWILATDGVSYRGTNLALGSDAQTAIGQVFGFLGHGVRGAYDEFDTDWYTITDPGDMGLRGVFIEGFAFLFFGPDPNNPDRPETFVRHRFVGPTVDAAGNARPDNYATTAEGITVGHTLADLRAAYGSRVAPGSNSEESYYRLTDSGGELCFYFDTPEEPPYYSPITEISSECRTD